MDHLTKSSMTNNNTTTPEGIALARAAQPAPAVSEQALLTLCDQLDGMRRTMFLRPGTGQNYSYLVHEDVQAYVEQARAALAHGATRTVVSEQAEERAVASALQSYIDFAAVRRCELGELSPEMEAVDAQARAALAHSASSAPAITEITDGAARTLIDFIYERIGFTDRDVLIGEVQRIVIGCMNASYAAGVRDTTATPASAQPVAAAPADSSEAAELLDSLIYNIDRSGNYSVETTLTFLNQIKQCLAPAAPVAQATPGDISQSAPASAPAAGAEQSEKAAAANAGVLASPTYFYRGALGTPHDEQPEDPRPDHTDAALGAGYRAMLKAHRNGLKVDFTTGLISLPDDRTPAADAGQLTAEALAQMLAGKHVNDYGYRMLLNGEEIGFNLDHLLDIVKTAAGATRAAATSAGELPDLKAVPSCELRLELTLRAGPRFKCMSSDCRSLHSSEGKWDSCPSCKRKGYLCGSFVKEPDSPEWKDWEARTIASHRAAAKGAGGQGGAA